MSVRLIQGDCREVLRTLEANSVDAVITDPPYGLGFMDREWDTFRPGTVQRRAAQRERKQSSSRSSRRWPARGGTTQGGGPSVEYDESLEGNRAFQAWCEEWARECLRVLKPGGHLLAFGGPRTEHRLVCGIEDAGFQIRDKLVWLFGSGYPKSWNLCRCPEPRPAELDRWHWTTCGGCGGRIELGTALKPAWEPIVMARKPLGGTVLRNVEQWGVGALNIDGSRLEDALNRWPPNACLDEVAAAALDLAVGKRRSGANPTRRNGPKHWNLYGDFLGQAVCVPQRGADSGGPSRFFYCPKPSRKERNAGLLDLPSLTTSDRRNVSIDNPYLRAGTARRNHHPTVKPIALMRWLVRLVTWRGATVVDPFVGSGTTGIACSLEERDFYGIDREQEYLDISERRIAYWQGPMFAEVEG